MNPVKGTLLILGAGFLVANALLILEYLRFLKRRKSALLTWPSPKPPYYGLALAIGVATGLLMFFKVVISHQQAFGETMMFLYYAYLFPLSRRIRRGFYEDGIWADTVFIPYNEVGGVSWREGEHSVTLIHHLAAAQPCTSSQRAGRQIRRGAAPAPGQDRRTRDLVL